jgi:lactate dehydrogenase-like 2-hydroxyacid dehydrogenase
MTLPILLVTRRLPAAVIDRLRPACTLRLHDADTAIDRAALLQQIAGAAGLLCMLTERVDEELLAAAGPSLKFVSTMSVGYDHIDIAACARHGVAVGNTPGVLTDTTADLTLALMLATARRLPEGSWGVWQPEWMIGVDLFGATVGIVGMGRIGAAVARRLQGFDCRLLYSGPRPRPELAGPVAAAYVPFPALLAESDFVTIHCPLNAATRHLFDHATLAQMKPGAILINTSRGGTVDQAALYDALRFGPLRAAGLDVTTPEPLPPSHPLLTLPNCVILPHVGSATVATRLKMAQLAAGNALAGLAAQPLPNPVATLAQL